MTRLHASGFIVILQLKVHYNSDKVFRGSSLWGKGGEFFALLENYKNCLWERTRKRRIGSFIVIKRIEVGLKSEEPILGVRSLGQQGEEAVNL